VRDANAQVKEDKKQFDIAFLQYILLAFAGIALFVGAFVIANTALDHDRAADARVRHATDARRLAPAGAVVGDRRGLRHRRGRLRDRPLPWVSLSRRG
jgi:hypothetical protein